MFAAYRHKPRADSSASNLDNGAIWQGRDLSRQAHSRTGLPCREPGWLVLVSTPVRGFRTGMRGTKGFHAVGFEVRPSSKHQGGSNEEAQQCGPRLGNLWSAEDGAEAKTQSAGTGEGSKITTGTGSACTISAVYRFWTKRRPRDGQTICQEINLENTSCSLCIYLTHAPQKRPPTSRSE